MNMRMLIRLIVVALLGAATALLVSCGSSGTGLIPSASAGPLQEDFEAVAKAAEAGNGNCSKTEEALGKTEEDFLALPATVDRGLHKRLEEGIANLRKQALAMCEEPTATETATTSTETTSTESATTPTTPTNTVTTPPASTPPPGSGGGVEAPEEGAGENGTGLGASKEGADNGASNSGGASAGDGQ